MERITKKQLQMKVNYINRMLQRPDTYMTEDRKPNKGHLFIDRYAPGGNPYKYKLAELMDNFGESDWTNYRMKIREFDAYLTGIIDGIERRKMK